MLHTALSGYLHSQDASGRRSRRVNNIATLLRLFLAIVAAGVLIQLAPQPAFGQVLTSGAVAGTVRDASGAVLGGAQVELQDAATGLVRRAQAEDQGTFFFSAMSPGTFRLTVTRSGFQTLVFEQVIVNAGRTTDVNAVLSLSQVQQRVEVTAEIPDLQTTSTTISSTIETQAIQDLPLSGRDVMSFAYLTPGYASQNGGQYGTYNGIPGAAMNFSTDGANNVYQKWKSAGTSFANYPVVARLENVQEMTISTSALGVDTSGGAAQVQFVSKRGGDKFRGQLFEQYRNSALNANSWSNNANGLVRRRMILNDFGGNISGPILKKKVFFFLGLSASRQPVTSYTSAAVLTPEAQSGIFRYIGSDGVTRTVNVLQLAAVGGYQGSVSPTIQAKFKAINDSFNYGFLAPDILYRNRLNYALGGRTTNRYPSTRIDWNATENFHVYLAGTLDWATSIDLQPLFPGPAFANGRTPKQATHWTSTAGAVWTPRPTLVSEFKVGWLSALENFTMGLNPDPATERFVSWPLGLKSPFTVLQPHSTNSPVTTINDATHIQRGSHTLDLGGSYMVSDVVGHQQAGGFLTYSLGIDASDPVASVLTTSAFPQISQSSLTEARNLYALLTGRVTSISTSNYVDPRTGNFAPYIERFSDLKQRTAGLFVRDVWRLRAGLTLNFGLRWDLFGSIFDATDTYASAGPQDIWGPSGVGNLFKPGTLAGNPDPLIVPRSHFYDASLKNPAPSAGFAWTPRVGGLVGKLLGNGKTVIRGGYGLSHFTVGSYTVDSPNAGPGLTQRATTSTGQPGFTAGAVTLDTAAPPLQLSPATRSFPIHIVDASVGGGSTAAAIKPDIGTPYVQSWSFGIQRELSGGNVLEVRYVGNRGGALWRPYDLNEVNIFENGFLPDFVNAQKNLAINQANGVSSFANLGRAGQTAIPIFENAFGALGSMPALSTAQGFQNGTFVSYLSQGQAGAFANSMRSTTYLCRLVGSNSPQCATSGYTAAGKYPVNFFVVNPYSSTSYLSDTGFSSYDGLQVQLRRRFAHGLSLAGNYTFSKSMTNKGHSIDDTGTLHTLRNPGLDRRIADYDITHIFNTYGIYELPAGPGKKFLGGRGLVSRFAGSWSLSWIVKIQTGPPFALTGGTQTFNNRGDSGVVLNGMTRADLQKNVGVYRTGRDFFYFINPNLLRADGSADPNKIAPATAPGTFGSFIYLHGPGFFNTDLAITKRFSITERFKGRLQTEMLNTFNHPNRLGSTGNLSIQATTFGQSRSYGSPRSIQFRLTIQF